MMICVNIYSTITYTDLFLKIFLIWQKIIWGKMSSLIYHSFFFENSFHARITVRRWRCPSYDINFGTSSIVVVSAKRPTPGFITRVTVTLSHRTTFIFSRVLVINREKKHLTLMPFYYPPWKLISSLSYIVHPVLAEERSSPSQGGNSRENFVGTPGIRKGRRTKARRRFQAALWALLFRNVRSLCLLRICRSWEYQNSSDLKDTREMQDKGRIWRRENRMYGTCKMQAIGAWLKRENNVLVSSRVFAKIVNIVFGRNNC